MLAGELDLKNNSGQPEFLNQQFNHFLQINPQDLAVLRRYESALTNHTEDFPNLFYQYLFGFPATAEILEQFRQEGGKIESLAEHQKNHLLGLIKGDVSESNSQDLIHIGKIHYRRQVKPVWIMGSYQLYMDHLRTIITNSATIDPRDRRALQKILGKLLFRDIGLMQEGYWIAATEALQNEKQNVEKLQGQVSDLLANIPQVLWSVDVSENRILYISPGYRQQVQPNALPIPMLNSTSKADQQRIIRAWKKVLQGEALDIECNLETAHGEIRWCRWTFHPYPGENSEVIRIDGILEDITDLKQTMGRLEHLATTDTLTGLANRTLWYDRLNHALSTAVRKHKKRIAVMMLDMNQFKVINDTMGHPAGDEALRQATQRMRQVLRGSDTLARLGGDEFGILLADNEDSWHAAKHVALKVLACFDEPFNNNDCEMYLGASIGITIFPDHGQDADTLVSRADIAMYRAKNKGVGFMFYDPGTDGNSMHQLQLSNQLRQAVNNDELELHFQPKIDIETGKLCGSEALLRWRHPKHGLVEPDNFIPIAEEIGMITPITEWVISQALKKCAEWRHQGYFIPMAVNVSALSFQNPKLVEQVKAALQHTRLDNRCLELEITENTLMADVDHNFDVLMALSELGVSIAVDDFGTGYSSLAYLKRLPINTLKIDKSFVMDMTLDENDATIVRSIIDLGHNLGFNVIAEGVESADTWALLDDLGCDAAQGFHISPPVPASHFTKWMTDGDWYGAL